jgi:hypothetical protein
MGVRGNPVQGSSEARLRKRRKGAAGQGECSSYAGMNRVKFAGLNLSTGVHPGAGSILPCNGISPFSGQPCHEFGFRMSTLVLHQVFDSGFV